MHAPQNKDDGVAEQRMAGGGGGAGVAGARREEGVIDTATVEAIGVSIEEVERMKSISYLPVLVFCLTYC